MTVTYDVDEAVATITLNRPDAMNSLTVAMKTDLLAAVLDRLWRSSSEVGSA